MKSTNLRAVPMPWNKFKLEAKVGVPEANKPSQLLKENGVVVGKRIPTKRR